MNIDAERRKFQDPLVTARGEDRAVVELTNPQTLWFNTGTLCNIQCAHCYIESSPSNDQLVYLSAREVDAYLDELEMIQWGVKEIGFTGGEPFMNPELLTMLESALSRGYQVLVLTNAMRPMSRPRVQARLKELIQRYQDRLVLRVSIDHWRQECHDQERGEGSFAQALQGMRWLKHNHAKLNVAGRLLWDEDEGELRAGYATLFEAEALPVDAHNPSELVLFPEMEPDAEVPEITTACWGILNKSPESVMCSSSRMVVKRKGAEHPVVLACTLIAYDEAFELGSTLQESARPVPLNHVHCAKFCVLGGASCSG